MAEILHHPGCLKPCKQWDKLPINSCRISSINSREIPPNSLSLTTYRTGYSFCPQWKTSEKIEWGKSESPGKVEKAWGLRWMFPKIGVGPQIGLFTMENPMNKWMIWGALKPLFLGWHPSWDGVKPWAMLNKNGAAGNNSRFFLLLNIPK